MGQRKSRHPRSAHSLIASLVLALVAIVAMSSTAYAHAATSPSNASQTPPDANTGKLLRSKTPAEIQREQQKEALVAAWEARTHNGMQLPASAGAAAVQPYCVTDPDTGQCVIYYTHSIGGEYTQEPYDEPNWCGPSSATAVMMHWNYNAVVNYGSATG